MSKFSTKGVVRVLSPAFIGKDGNQIDYLNEALRQEADCGCGIDCCNNELKLKVKETGEVIALYFEPDGEGFAFKARRANGDTYTIWD